MTKTKKLLITDLDNTLYCWAHFYANCHKKAIEFLSGILEKSIEDICKNHAVLAKEFGDTEYPLIFDSLACIPPVLVTKNKNVLSRQHITSLMHKIFEANRSKYITLYPTVFDTLKEIFKSKIPIVIYTDASAYNAHCRLKVLGIENLFSSIYCKNHGGSAYEFLNNELPAFKYTILDKGVKKPSGDTLLRICNQYNIDPQDAIYVGDSFVSDMISAKEAKIPFAFAEYGTKRPKDSWEYLVNITAWTPEKVKQETELKLQYKDVAPELTIKSFDEILPFMGLYR